MFKKPGGPSSKAIGYTYDSRDRLETAAPTAAVPTATQQPWIGSRTRLPVAAYKNYILYSVETNATTIIIGETGSGKTTQIPQFLYEGGWAEEGFQIVCTQPRRVAAFTVAARVAEEMGCELGTTVGFAVRFEEAYSASLTKIKFVTDGVLLREMLDDPLLTAYSVIVVDEVHERSLSTDMLLGLLKKVQQRRPELRLIVASATLQAEKLVTFFDTSHILARGRVAGPGHPVNRKPAVLTLPGKTHPVQVHYLSEPTADYVLAAVRAAVDIHREDAPGDILIFLTGQEECEAAVKLLDDEAVQLAKSNLSLRMLPLPLYAGLPGPQQRAVMQPPPRGVRKVVVATNVAETSLTIEGVVYVVDSMFVKQRCYNPILGLEALLVAPESQASAKQRAGRSGRVRPGHCFRLCTKDAFQSNLPVATVPEMQRSDLSSLVLQLKALGVDNIMRFEWLAPPPAEAMVRALEQLHALGILDDDARLTSNVGVPISALPLSPAQGRCLLASTTLGCAEEMCTILSMLATQRVWAGSGGSVHAREEAQAKFAAAEGDLITYLNVWEGWERKSRSSKWCRDHFINSAALHRADKIRAQLIRQLKRFQLPVTSCEGDITPVERAITAGMFMNAACFVKTDYNPLEPNTPGANVYRLVRLTGSAANTIRVKVHPSSVLLKVQPTWVVCDFIQQSSQGWFEMQGVTAIELDWLMEYAGHVFQLKRGGPRSA